MSAGRGYSGKYKVEDRVTTKVISWTVGTSKEKQTPFIRVTLDGNISWTGWLKSDKSKEITIKALQVMGFKGTDLSQIKLDNALDTQKDVVAVIGEVRPYKGNNYYDAKFINYAKTKGFQGEAKDEGVFETLKDIGTKEYIEDAKDLSPSSSSYTPGFDPSFAADDLPF